MTALTDLLDSALAARANLVDVDHTSAWRLFNGFLEGQPDVCVDIYAKTGLIHDNSQGSSPPVVAETRDWLLARLPWLKCVLVKSRTRHTDDSSRGSLIHGTQPDDRIYENGVWYALDLLMNRDASFYLDTRGLRAWAKSHLSGKTVLNTFAYTGSLGVAALACGAERVIQMDRNSRYLRMARQSCLLNGLPTDAKDFMAQDFFPTISFFKHRGQLFDCVFLDPPFFASSSKGRVDLEEGSSRLINKVRPLIQHGGWLVTINNALFVSGQEYLASLQNLCAGGFLEIEELIPVPADFTGYPGTVTGHPPSDPAPFNHSTKIAVLRVLRKSAS